MALLMPFEREQKLKRKVYICVSYLVTKVVKSFDCTYFVDTNKKLRQLNFRATFFAP